MRLLQFVDSVLNKAIDPYHIEIEVPSQLLEEEPVAGRIVSEKEIPAIKGTELLLSNGIRLIYKESVSAKERISMSAYRKGGLFALDSTDYVNGVFSPNVISLSGQVISPEMSFHIISPAALPR